ncbi:MAG: FAD binding domain-containing protein [Burkholderiales bacterium]|nr:FAD binding domain-containing protein [Burkholderiales bacterium]
MTAQPQGSCQQSFQRAGSLEGALATLALGPVTVLAGGTDLYPALASHRAGSPMLDISALAPLRAITRVDGATAPALRLGALTTWSVLARGALPGWARALELAAREVGGVQIQNRGTLGGNLCHASPAADGVPALLALDARIELASHRGVRSLPLDQFILGPRRTARQPDELLTAIELPEPAPTARSTFLKLGHRRYLVISIAMVAIALELGADARVTGIRLAVGSCGPMARRLPLLEERLLGRLAPLDPGVVMALIDAAALAPLSPIDDVRGTATYRLDAVGSLIARGVAGLSREALS